MPTSLDSFVVPDNHRYKTAMSFVVEVLRQGILTGAITEGTPLRQEDLAAKFGMSRMPIRDAIRQLEAEGLVVHEPHKGAAVATMTIADIIEIYDMRIMAECTALKLAFESISEEDLSRMNDAISAMENTDDPHKLSELNQQFHALLFGRVARPRLHSLIKSLHDSVDRHLRFLLTNLNYHQKSQKDHRDIVQALRSGDREAAEKLLETHLSQGRDAIVSFLDSRNAQRGS
ncbi:HTH-type transcriptional repressor RspR [Pseudomonas fluorescens]|uniref:GntR family transcriptional regulator n=1 Tax=Pseudomonas fluorescens TaxID=294 RepID=UPI001253DF83|nr:GntR family transcriptional regulator [Pseudomonas fluorescens]CAG8867952.1 HTH-type transcriptional repressor RspR [Pseudomonas fluorescens]VVP81006.1 HTH-type transcriptional repressor RspR [Pseudomonas fluorescens]